VNWNSSNWESKGYERRETKGGEGKKGSGKDSKGKESFGVFKDGSGRVSIEQWTKVYNARENIPIKDCIRWQGRGNAPVKNQITKMKI